MKRATRPALLSLVFPVTLLAQDTAPDDDGDPFGLEDPPAIEAVDQPVSELAAGALDAMVVITQGARDGTTAAVGSGFVVSADGLVATCAHVIGESRPLGVRFADGSEHEVTAIHAWNRKLDLAVLRIDREGLEALPLAPPDELTQGAEVVAMGNPHGLDFSVVRGVASALRTIGEQPLIQVAIPIEPGNSGGPLLDTAGRVHGLLTMKSAVTDNLGFAVPVDGLHRLLEKPNTVAMDKWLTIGKLDPKRWRPAMGARWRQRAGRITAERPGDGFGGRSLCIAQREVPAPPYEVAVEVQLDDEAGAAGLIFASDGGDRHYGFYPSGGNIRLTRFEGPDVLSWTILSQQASPAYRPGEWNRIRVRVGEKRISGFVNGVKVVELEDAVLRGGKVGLAKFRDTVAAFKRFELGGDLAHTPPPEAELARLGAHVDSLISTPDDPDALEGLAASPELAGTLLQRRAKRLTETARALESAADLIHRRGVQRQLVAQLETGDDAGLARCALLVARYDNAELDVDAYLDELDRMAAEIRTAMPDGAAPAATVAAIGEYLFEDNGYHGSRADYYNRSNSYLNEVIDDREGIPITFSILFIELAGRLGVDLRGLGLPGHFVAFYEVDGGRQVIDPFEGGDPLDTAAADALVRAFGGDQPAAAYPEAGTRAIIQRMIYNLKGISIDDKDYASALRYVDLLVAIDPDDAQERLSRALLLVQTEQGERAKADLDWLFEKEPEGIHLDRLRELYDRL